MHHASTVELYHIWCALSVCWSMWFKSVHHTSDCVSSEDFQSVGIFSRVLLCSKNPQINSLQFSVTEALMLNFSTFWKYGRMCLANGILDSEGRVTTRLSAAVEQESLSGQEGLRGYAPVFVRFLCRAASLCHTTFWLVLVSSPLPRGDVILVHLCP